MTVSYELMEFHQKKYVSKIANARVRVEVDVLMFVFVFSLLCFLLPDFRIYISIAYFLVFINSSRRN